MDSTNGEKSWTGEDSTKPCEYLPHYYKVKVTSPLKTTSQVFYSSAHRRPARNSTGRMVHSRMPDAGVDFTVAQLTKHALLDPLTQAGVKTGVVLLRRDTFEKEVGWTNPEFSPVGSPTPSS